MARVQAPDYRSHTVPAGHGGGAYRVITVRDVESEEDLARLGGLINVTGVARAIARPSDTPSSLGSTYRIWYPRS